MTCICLPTLQQLREKRLLRAFERVLHVAETASDAIILVTAVIHSDGRGPTGIPVNVLRYIVHVAQTSGWHALLDFLDTIV